LTSQSEWKIVGQLVNASNATLVVEIDHERYVYKPISGERPLWDFPDGTLALRERAAYVLSHLLGWNLVPETILAEGPYGTGSLQTWLTAEVEAADIFDETELPKNWLIIASGMNEEGQQVTLAHADDLRLKQIALFDAVINNADRKAGHILTNESGEHFGIDHGVTFSAEDKLRTVLWGWINETIPSNWLSDLRELRDKIDDSEIAELLDSDELAALHDRIESLIASEKFPAPNPQWPAVPWPVF
jgi:uncharacterized repeat protein (TIGR03843 family)